MNKIICNIEILDKNFLSLPNKFEIYNLLIKICNFFLIKIEISIRIVNIKEILLFNYKYRGKNNSTNILSFIYNIPKKIKSYLLGDLIICHEIIKKEFYYKFKSFKKYWIYILIHGILHLLGYNHFYKNEYIEMEILKLILLNKLSF